MRRLSLGLAALVLMGVGACGGEEPAPPEEGSETAADAAEDTATPSAEDEVTPAAASEAVMPDADPVPAAPGAPIVAVIYPGGAIQPPAEETGDAAGPDGTVTYVTAATPDEVVAFHRARAEAEGLASVMAMNQGESRAYGAHDTNNGANLSVFATPGEEGGASVQLIWSTGG